MSSSITIKLTVRQVVSVSMAPLQDTPSHLTKALSVLPTLAAGAKKSSTVAHVRAAE